MMESKFNLTSNIKKSSWLIVLTIASIASIVAWVYFTRIESPNYINRYVLHQEIIEGVAGSPYRYRVLVPYLADLLFQLGKAAGVEGKLAFNFSYIAINVTSLYIFLLFSYKFFRCFYAEKTSLIGILFIGCMIHIGLQDHYYQPWSVTEAAFFVIALFLLKKEKTGSLWLLTLFASFNRETAILIPSLAFISMFPSLRFRFNSSQYRNIAIALLVWLIVFLGLRFILGGSNHVISIYDLIKINLSTSGILKAFFNFGLILGGWWFILFKSFQNSGQDKFIIHSWGILLLYIPLVLIFGVWAEVRLLIPLYPLAIASCLFIFEKELSDVKVE